MGRRHDSKIADAATGANIDIAATEGSEALTELVEARPPRNRHSLRQQLSLRVTAVIEVVARSLSEHLVDILGHAVARRDAGETAHLSAGRNRQALSALGECSGPEGRSGPGHSGRRILGREHFIAVQCRQPARHVDR